MYPIPQGHEREAKEETDGSAKVRHKCCPRVDQLFPFHVGVIWDRVQAEQEVGGLIRCGMSVAFNPILHVMARLQTSCLFVDSNQVFIHKFFKEFFIFPIEVSWTVVFVMNRINGYLLSTTYNQPVLLDVAAVLLLNTILVPGQLATHLGTCISSSSTIIFFMDTFLGAHIWKLLIDQFIPIPNGHIPKRHFWRLYNGSGWLNIGYWW